MQVLKRKKTSRCTDAKIVYEYILSEPVEKKFISILQDCGITETKQLGKLILFSFQEGRLVESERDIRRSGSLCDSSEE